MLCESIQFYCTTENTLLEGFMKFVWKLSIERRVHVSVGIISKTRDELVEPRPPLWTFDPTFNHNCAATTKGWVVGNSPHPRLMSWAAWIGAKSSRHDWPPEHPRLPPHNTEARQHCALSRDQGSPGLLHAQHKPCVPSIRLLQSDLRFTRSCLIVVNCLGHGHYAEHASLLWHL